MRIRSASQFIHIVGDEFSWRNKELVDFRMLARSSQLIARKVILRAGVPLAYAHWEGFVKKSTEHLLNFISHQGLANEELADCFFAHSVKTHVHHALESAKPMTVIEAVCFVRDARTKKAEIRHKNYVDVDSNLSSEVFEQLALSVGVDTRSYQHYYPYIDESVVNSRNKIAHGEHLELSIEDFHAMIDKVSTLLRMYKTDIENIVAQGHFRA